MRAEESTSRALMYAGVLPFLVGTLAALFEIDSWWVITNIPLSLAMYALAIASFMSGIHWGLVQTKSASPQLLLLSNLMVLLPWIAFVFLGLGVFFYAALAYVFFKQVLIDQKLAKGLAKDSLFSDAYLRDRSVVGFSVTFLMVVLAVLHALA